MNEVHAEIKKEKERKDGKKRRWGTICEMDKRTRKFISRMGGKGFRYRWLHGLAEKKYRRSNYSFTIPVIIMSTLTGTANFAMDSFVPEEYKTAMAGVGGVNILAGIISTLQNF